MSPSNRLLASMVYDSHEREEVMFGGYHSAYLADTWIYNATSGIWANVTAHVAPPGRYGASMAYLSGENRVLLFGGEIGFNIFTNDTWMFDPVNDTWTRATPSTEPYERWGGAIDYDSATDRVFLFGGYVCAPGAGCGALNDAWSYDPGSNQWTALAFTPSPAVGEGAGMVYDPIADRFLLFGGTTLNNTWWSNQTWVYDYNTNSWTQAMPASSPARAAFAGMAYVGTHDRALLFGGRAAGFSNATWSYDYSTDTWTNRTNAFGPSPRGELPLAFDVGVDRLLLFGGSLALPINFAAGDMWSFDPVLGTWSAVGSNAYPAGREASSMVYDGAAGRLILFGGQGEPFGFADADTWAFDYATQQWTNLTTPNSPPPREWASMVYDSKARLVLLFGGNDPYAGGERNDTWSYDYSVNLWTNLSPTHSPSPRDGAGMVYDILTDRSYLWGGYPLDSNTYGFDATNNTWTQLVLTGTPPPARAFQGMAYDSRFGEIQMFGGAYTPADNRTWLLNPNPGGGWATFTVTVSPPPLADATLVYDPVTNASYLFGGANFKTLKLSSETWSFDIVNATWKDLGPVQAPSARAEYGIAYDSAANRMILFGGGGGTFFATPAGEVGTESWSFDVGANRWTLLSPGPAPMPRSGAALVYDTVTRELVLFGGGSFSDLFDDTWLYDLASDRWSRASPATHPSPRYDAAMTFDAAADRIVMFGGRTPTSVFNDTWTFDAATDTWTNLTAGVGPPVYSPLLAYDPTAGLVVLYGTHVTRPFLGLTWELDVNSGRWTNVTPAESPLGDAGFWVDASLAYIPTLDRLLLIMSVPRTPAGVDLYTGGPYEWTFDPAARAWTNVTVSGGPSPASLFASAYDGRVDRTVLFEGMRNATSGYVPDNATWTYDASSGTWANATVPGPPFRFDSVEAFAAGPNFTVMFGGYQRIFVSAYGVVRSLGDTWLYRASPVPPSAPLTLAATRTGATVDLSWHPPTATGGAPIQGYNVYRATAPVGLTLIATVGDVGTYGDATIQPGTTYYYELRAVNSIGEGPSSNEVAVGPLPLVATILATPLSGAAPLDVAFNASVTGGSPPYAVLWDFGDGYQSTLPRSSHVYTSPGIFVATARVTDSLNRQTNQTVSIHVQPPAGTAPGGPLGTVIGSDAWLWLVLAAILVAGAVVGFIAWRRTSRARESPKGPPPA